MALTISFSRSDRAHTDLDRSWCRVSQRTVPDVLQLLESLLRAPENREGPIRRACHLIRCAREGQRVRARNYPPEAPPRPDRSSPIVPALTAEAADTPAPLTRDSAAIATRLRRPVRHTPWWRAVSRLRPSARHLVSGANRLSTPALRHQSRLRERAPPVDDSTYRRSLPCVGSILDRRCCIVVTWP